MEKGERVPGEKVTSTYCHLDHFRSLLDEIEKSTGSFEKERKKKKKRKKGGRVGSPKTKCFRSETFSVQFVDPIINNYLFTF